MEKLRGNWKHQTQDILWRFCRGITRDRFLHKSTFSLIWNLTVRNDWAQSLKGNAMIILTSDPVFCAHSENTSYPNHHDGVRFGTLIFSFWFFLAQYHLVPYDLVAYDWGWCGLVCLVCLSFYFFWCAWYAKILEYLLFWSNMIGGGMVWFGPLGMQDESKDCQQKPSNHYRAHLIYIIFSFYLNIIFII